MESFPLPQLHSAAQFDEKTFVISVDQKVPARTEKQGRNMKPTVCSEKFVSNVRVE